MLRDWNFNKHFNKQSIELELFYGAMNYGLVSNNRTSLLLPNLNKTKSKNNH